MSIKPGFKTRVYITAAAVTMTSEPLSQSGSSKTYFTTDAAKNVWNPEAAFTVYDDGVAVDADDVVIDYLMGKVTFADSYTVTEPVTVDGAYLPRHLVAGARSSQVTVDREDVDATRLVDDAKQALAGQQQVSGAVQSLDLATTEYGTSQTIITRVESGSAFLFEHRFDPTEATCVRAWVRLLSAELASELSEPQTATLGFVGALTGALKQAASYGDPTA